MTNQKGAAHLFILLILLIGIGLGVYLSLNPTVFRPKASTNNQSPHLYWDFEGQDTSNISPQIGSMDLQGFGSALSFVEGKSGKALNFNGVDDYLQSKSDFYFINPLQTLSVSAWIKPIEQPTKYFQILVKDPRPSQQSFGLWVSSNNSILARVTTDQGLFDCQTDTNTIKINQWSHIVFVYNGLLPASESNRLSIYIDGIKAKECPGLGNIRGSDLPLRIGGKDDETAIGTNFFKGEIDEIKFFSNPLKPYEVIILSNLNSSSPSLIYSPNPVPQNSQVRLEWNNYQNAAADDYIGLYKISEDNLTPLTYWFLNTCANNADDALARSAKSSGQCIVTLPADLKSSEWEFRLNLRQQAATVTKSSPLIISSSGAQDDITRAKNLHKDSLVLLAHTHNFTKNDLQDAQNGGVTTLTAKLTVDGIDWDRNNRTRFNVSSDWSNRFVNALVGVQLLAGQANSNVIIIRRADDILTAKRLGKVGVILGSEGANQLEGNIGKIQEYYNLGWRETQLGWDARESNNALISGQQLTTFGKQVLLKAKDLGILIDVSHQTAGQIEQVTKITDAPLILSHDAPISVGGQIGDDIIDRVAQSGGGYGVIALHFLKVYLGNDKASLDSLLDGIDYIKNRVGVDHVALGGDYVPEDAYPPVLEIQDLEKLTLGLVKRGYTDDEIKKVLGLNLLNFYKRVWK